MFLSFLLLHEERSVIRSRNKTLSGVSSRCGHTPENTSATQYSYQFSMVIWKLCIFFSFSWVFFIHLEGKPNKLSFYMPPLPTLFEASLRVGDRGPCCVAAVSHYLVLPKFTPLLHRIHFSQRLIFSHRNRKKGVFLLRKILDKALLPFSVTCQYVFVRLTAQDKCPSCTRGKGQPIIHSL